MHLIRQMAARTGNVTVHEASGNDCPVELKVPYCVRCRFHQWLAMTGWVGYGCALSILSLAALGAVMLLVVALFVPAARADFFSDWAPGWLGRLCIGVGIVAFFALFGLLARRLGNLVRKKTCAPLDKAVEFQPGGEFIGWIQFGNASYAHASARANHLEIRGPASTDAGPA
ncbi:MAG: hypothetical protein Q8N53_08345 [Longimicrobiales bacterium]|nr:hypothetical protein [Longimicrobiales bacterium]